MNRGCHDGSAPRNDESHCQLQYNQQLPGGKFIIQKMLKKFQFNLSADKSAGDEDGWKNNAEEEHQDVQIVDK